MRTRPPARWPFVLCPLSFVLLLGGCGLSDYGGQMSSEAARVQAWDDEAALLGAAVKMPELPKKEDKDQHWDVYLRLPQGVAGTPKTADNASQAKMFGPLVQYEGSSRAGVVNVYLGVGGEQKDFAASVYNQFPGVTPGGSTVTVPRNLFATTSARKVSPSVNLKQQVAEVAPYVYSFNFYERNNDQVAVVYQMDKANVAKAETAVKASLATLGLNDEAGALRAIYTQHQIRK